MMDKKIEKCVFHGYDMLDGEQRINEWMGVQSAMDKHIDIVSICHTKKHMALYYTERPFEPQPTPAKSDMLLCPFCGGDEVKLSISGCYVICNECKAEGPYNTDQNESESIACWNDRTPQPPQTMSSADDNPWRDAEDVPPDNDRDVEVKAVAWLCKTAWRGLVDRKNRGGFKKLNAKVTHWRELTDDDTDG